MNAFFVLILFFSLYPFYSKAKELTQLGERSNLCENLETDEIAITYDRSLRYEAKNLWESQQLNTAIVSQPNCYRVGTEVRLNIENETIPYLGKAFIKNIRILNARDLSQNKSTGFSKNTVSSYIEKNPSNEYGLITYKVTERIEESVLKEKYDRLKSCFPSFSDWETLPLKEDQQDLLQQIQQRKKTAFIWNGTYNCYKVGVYTEILFPGTQPKANGYILPTELQLVHFTNLKQKHADLLGISLNQLKEDLTKDKELDGGYVTIVVFEYLNTEPQSSSDSNSTREETEQQVTE